MWILSPQSQIKHSPLVKKQTKKQKCWFYFPPAHVPLPSEYLATFLGVDIDISYSSLLEGHGLVHAPVVWKLIFFHSMFRLGSFWIPCYCIKSINYSRMKCPRRKSLQRKPYFFGAKEWQEGRECTSIALVYSCSVARIIRTMKWRQFIYYNVYDKGFFRCGV